jgi:superoxide dismutase, Fe-Mn family
MAFELPPLPYPFDALEPHIDAKTMEIHHDKHHGTYVNNLNGAIEKHSELQQKDLGGLLRGLQSVPEDVRTVIRNNGGGHANHLLFWQIMSPDGGGQPGGELGKAIESTLGGFEQFKEQLTKAAVGQFGSGWGWLILTSGGQLQVKGLPNQDSPHMEGATPILGVDVWEHAYYLKYQNRRADYVAAWWNVVNWKAAEARYAEARGQAVAR